MDINNIQAIGQLFLKAGCKSQWIEKFVLFGFRAMMSIFEFRSHEMDLMVLYAAITQKSPKKVVDKFKQLSFERLCVAISEMDKG